MKACVRAAMAQSGFPDKTWDMAARYGGIMISVARKATILPWERNDDGTVKAGCQHKLKQSCWEAFHRGEPFTGPIKPFGCLVYYLDRDDKHPLMPTTSPGLFVGYRL